MSDRLCPAVLIDRDGTIMEGCEYCSDPKDVRIFPGVVDALSRLKSRGGARAGSLLLSPACRKTGCAIESSLREWRRQAADHRLASLSRNPRHLSNE